VAHTDARQNVDIQNIDKGPLMPNVVGMGLRDALYILESRGLSVKFTGSGVVKSQSIRAGVQVDTGQTVILTLR
jgi:cell division protein FtsI (penicillin-binding protein 3)